MTDGRYGGAIIAGTGMEMPGEGYVMRTVETVYGVAVVYIAGDDDPVFLSRHGTKHTIPPHRINYLANLKALQLLGVDRLISTLTVGSIADDVPPGTVLVVDQLLDFTFGRPATFFDGDGTGVMHVEFTDPFCTTLREKFLAVAREAGMDVRRSGTYVCTNGPRLETAAEIRMFSQLGGDVVGMTAMPEAVLARELGIHYTGIAVSINWAAGVRGPVRIDEQVLADMRRRLAPLLVGAVTVMGARKCDCKVGVRPGGQEVGLAVAAEYQPLGSPGEAIDKAPP